MSFKAEVIADSTGTWVANGLRFATWKEAFDYGEDLGWRWTSVIEMRAVESDEPVSHRWEGGKAVPVCAHAWAMDEHRIEVCTHCGEERGEGR